MLKRENLIDESCQLSRAQKSGLLQGKIFTLTVRGDITNSTIEPLIETVSAEAWYSF